VLSTVVDYIVCVAYCSVLCKLGKIPQLGIFTDQMLSVEGGMTNCLFYQICWKNRLWIEIHHVMDKEKIDNHEIPICKTLGRGGSYY